MSVVVVGSINRDVVARVERIPQPGETVLGSTLTRHRGGKGANQACAAARAGAAPTHFLAAVGTDEDGGAMLAELAQDGVDVTGTLTLDTSTGTALISVSASGENAIVVVPGANAQFLTLTGPQRERVAQASVVVAQLEIPVETVLEAAQARGAGAVFVLNAAPSRALPQALLAEVDVLVVNEHELLEVAQVEEFEEAVSLLSQRVGGLVVTLGGEGSLVVTGGERHQIPAVRVDVVDTTGAGDTFVGVLAARLHHGDTLVQAARWGSVAGALAVTRPGAQEGIPTAQEVAAALG